MEKKLFFVQKFILHLLIRHKKILISKLETVGFMEQVLGINKLSLGGHNLKNHNYIAGEQQFSIGHYADVPSSGYGCLSLLGMLASKLCRTLNIMTLTWETSFGVHCFCQMSVLLGKLILHVRYIFLFNSTLLFTSGFIVGLKSHVTVGFEPGWSKISEASIPVSILSVSESELVSADRIDT